MELYIVLMMVTLSVGLSYILGETLENKKRERNNEIEKEQKEMQINQKAIQIYQVVKELADNNVIDPNEMLYAGKVIRYGLFEKTPVEEDVLLLEEISLYINAYPLS